MSTTSLRISQPGSAARPSAIAAALAQLPSIISATPRPSERADRGPGGQRAGAARELGAVAHRVALGLAADGEIRGGVLHRRRVHRRDGRRSRSRSRTGRSATCGRRSPTSRRRRDPGRGARGAGSPRPRGRTRRRRGPRRRARARRRRSSRGRRTRRCSPRRPGRRRSSAPSAPARTSSSSSARILPWSSTGTTCSWARPIPSSRSARVSVTWRFSPTTTRSGGAPARPCSRRS